MTREQAVPLTPSEETQQPRTTCGFCGHESHKRWCGDCSDGPCRRATQADYDVAADYKAGRDGLHPDAGNTEANHYDWFMPANPSGHVDAILDDFEAKLTEALTDPFVHDMAHSVLPLIAAYRALRDADKRRRAARTAQRARHYRASKARATPSDTPKEPSQ